MNYQETINWMFNQLPMYQLQGASAYKKDLTNTHLLIDHLDNPQDKIKCIHVAGTNGKGSTSHMLASILQEAGYKVGLYTSPHLKDFRERIKINGIEISEEFVTDFINTHKTFFEANDMSFFEMTVGLAFDYFAKEKVDIAIIEVGMGGRLDATNVITPLVSVITNIGLDHIQFLGNTLESVAFEKAGIIKSNVPVVIGEYTPETQPVFLAKAKECNSEIYFASDLISETYPSDLIGDYQLHNKKTVLQTIAVLNAQKEFKITPKNSKSGLLQVVKNTGLQGRWQQLSESPKVICDTAHNKNGLEIVLNQIQKETFEKLHIVLGVVNDKDLDEVLPLFPKNAIYYFCKPNIPRGLDSSILQEKAKKYNLKGDIYHSVAESYHAAKNNATKNDFIFIGGSTFVVAELPLNEGI
ncbi:MULTISPECIES: bifunctional folylpolyglutamate synthase/dihydrofolate synthase [Flavobacterium]|uniref:Dihydrofolate synthase/folylpolyglutamate synthase n=1 Tax=Flavobacterium gawalongense TaxID=2594432 RepID=A0A553BYQ2_9FLAO|nr:folylpolyglutamate synthase/dihydrofolate synthase family protein [Flavobacterium gawalongense]TRX01138.1 bifunctional folylpolyglutamate synthase/dihydrofolate synthase [Flavobacterium gawalongense]TRX05625.1 bifunctional folylpolyglutamate synthase/dihydrofolate synthase [Flavobacterium gawalongense]TRX13286.1 bifunctional folylpolyglutamate synthase/dihydrofolate synthase [Flavobacterium gawalongense]TRX15782.1 bifunctional folylpolyglutamate synthase/dihydrofolate synthase [Flavobacteriu